MALRSWRSLIVGVGLAAVLAAAPVAVVIAQPGRAATVRGSEERNFGRLVIAMPTAQRVSARVANGVLAIQFSEPVNISADRIVREMPAYLSVARVDPDGRGMRFALTRPFNANVMEAGEKVFIDLIPENWQGMLPGLPQEVVEELARRAQAAEAVARDIERSRERNDPTPIEVRASTLPTLSRLIFETPPRSDVEHRVENGEVSVIFRGRLSLEPSAIRSILPDGARLLELEQAPTRITMKIAAGPGHDLRAFREDDGLVVDFGRRDRTGASPEAPAPAASPAPTPRARAEAAARAAPQPAPAAQPAQAAARPTELPRVEPTRVEAPARASAEPPAPIGPQVVSIKGRDSDDGSRLDFVFPRPTPAAAWQHHGEAVLVFDTIDTITPADVTAALPSLVRDAVVTREGKATIVRLKLAQDGVIRFAPDGNAWALTTADKGVAPAEPLAVQRAIDPGGQTVLSIQLPGVSGVHWITMYPGEPPLAVATALAPPGAMPKPQRFVEFSLPQTAHGIVVAPVADDLAVRSGVGDVTIGRGSGISVSIPRVELAGDGRRPATLIADREAWREMRSGDTYSRMRELTARTAEAARSERNNARFRLAHFQLANGLAAETFGPLAAAQADDATLAGDRRVRIMRAIANIMLHRDERVEPLLGDEALKDDAEAQLWRAVADVRQGRHARALGVFRRSGEIIDAYPDMLQALIRPEIVRAAIEMRDAVVAEKEFGPLNDLTPEWLSREDVALLRAQLDEATGRPEAALAGYKALFNADSRPVAARAQLRGIQLANREDDKSMSSDEKLARLETVSVVWRGDEVEIQALGELGAIYADQQRWREAFSIARKANGFFADHPITRRLHDDTARQFEQLFTGGKADTLPRVDALALFYDFKEFLPIGRRGDEIIRHLADRLVELDLLDRAAELLQHQIDNRLNGAARATVATRLAMVQLMNNRPADALRALSGSRISELPRDVKRARQLLEAKALSDLSRTDLAMEILGGERGPEVDRLRADILWSARRWREAGEAHERILGDAWRGTEPLNELQRADAMRAAVAYVMSNEALALDRLRTKFAARMADTPDARTFAFLTGSARMRGGDIRDIARSVASADTMAEFMSEYRKRYPEFSSTVRRRQQPAAQPGEAAAPAATPATPGGTTPGQTSAAPAGERRG